MPRGENLGDWSDEHQSFTFNSKYNLAKFTPLIKKHFEEGGLDHAGVLAGVCGVSQATIWNWLNPKHPDFKILFRSCVDTYKYLAVQKTDQWHRESASGARKDANARTLNRRADRILGLTERTEQKVTHSVQNMDEVNAKLEQIEAEIEND